MAKEAGAAGLGEGAAWEVGLDEFWLPDPWFKTGGGVVADVLGWCEAVVGGGANPGGTLGLDGTGSERNTEGNETRLKVNFLKSAAAGVVSRRQILWLSRNDSRKVA